MHQLHQSLVRIFGFGLFLLVHSNLIGQTAEIPRLSQSFGTIAEAVEAAADGDTIALSAGTFNPETTVDIDKSVTVIGEGQDQTTILFGGAGASALHISASGVTMNDLTVDGGGQAVFGIHVRPLTSNTTIERITAKNCVQNGISFTGTNDDQGRNAVTDVTTTDNGLFGLGFGASQNVTISDVTAHSNNGGDIGVYNGTYTAQPNADLVFEEPLNVTTGVSCSMIPGTPEAYQITFATTNEDDFYHPANPTITVPAAWNRVFLADLEEDLAASPPIPAMTALTLVQPELVPGLVAAQSAIPSLGSVAMRNMNTGHWEVPVGLAIQSAVNRAEMGETIDLHAGTFTESVTTLVPLTIAGAEEGTTVIAEGDSPYVFELASGENAEIRTTLEGFTVADGTSGALIGSFTTLSGMTFSGHSQHGVAVREADDIDVIGSTFSANVNGLTVLPDVTVSGLTVASSTFSDHTGAGVNFPMQEPLRLLTGTSISSCAFNNNHRSISVHRSENLSIAENTFAGDDVGISIILNTHDFSDFTVSRNAFSDSFVGMEIVVKPSASLSGFTIVENTFTEHLWNGIDFGAGYLGNLPTEMQLLHNSFSNMPGKAIRNAYDSELTVQCNWMGAANVAGILPILSSTNVDVTSILISGMDAEPGTPGFQVPESVECVNFGGCAQPGACNYDASANVIFPLLSDCDFTSCAGCHESDACNYNPEATLPDNSLCVYPTSANLDCDGNCLNDADSDGICDENEVPGCADPLACNYIADAYTDEDNALCTHASTGYACDGSCLEDSDSDGVCDPFEVAGCMDSGACNYTTAATNDDGSCDYTTCAGCTVTSACNYDATATISAPDQCTYPDAPYLDCADGCVNDADADGVCDELEVPGCTDDEACNYDATATDADDSCTYPATYYNCAGDCLLDSDGDGVCNALEVLGCTNSFACNFDETATQENGSCVFTGCQGCMIEQACNYDPTATVAINALCEWAASPLVGCDGNCLNDANANGICDEEEVVGCMDATATNYNPQANVNGGCIAAVAGCMIPSACNFNALATTMVFADCDFESCAPPAAGGMPFFVIDGCMDQFACNYDENATTDDGSCEYASCIGCTNPAGCDYDAGNLYSSTCDYTCYGCTNSAAFNYNPAATIDDGSCTVYAYGCTVPDACNYDPTATQNDYSCEYTSCLGCMESDACNYDSGATLNSLESCDYPDEGYDCLGACLVDTDNDTVCDPFEIPGCSDNTACNYNAAATDPANCEYPDTHYDCDGQCLADADGDGVCDALEISGCTYDGACNYVANATEDDGSCEFVTCAGCTDSSACNYDSTATLNDPIVCDYPPAGYECDGECTADTDNDGTCDPFEIDGCTDSSACNYDSAATEEDNTCTYPMDVHGVNNVDCAGNCLNDADGDGVCDEDEVDGCMDTGACNYDALATDDLGCEYLTCAGCSISSACNYDLDADIIDNSTCTFADAGFDCDGTCLDINNNATCDNDEPTVIGCFDAIACNFHAGANVINNALCIYTQVACDSCSGETDGTGTVIDGDADDDLVCDADEITGCQDANACNFNANATDPPAAGQECIYTSAPCDTCSGATDGTGTVVDGDPDNDGVCAPDEITGCQDASACNYNVDATDPPAASEACVYATDPCDVCSGLTDGTGFVVDGDVDGDGICNTAEAGGCTYIGACNYNENATEDNGTCLFPAGCDTCSGETDGSGSVIDNDTDGDSVCDADEISGCQDNTACNYNQYATDDAGNCIYASGCDSCAGGNSGDGYVVDGDTDDDGVCDAAEIGGCTDGTACNYSDQATDDDGSCLYADAACASCNGAGGIDIADADGDGVCDANEVAGCQVPEACNYNASATDAAACVFATGCDSCDGSGGVTNGDANGNGVCDATEVEGCMDSSACNFNAGANVPSAACIYPVGCESCSGDTDGSGTTVANDTDGDGVCNADEVAGCQDATACNYDAAATDGGVDCLYANSDCEMCMDGAVVLLDVDGDGICDTDEPAGCVGDDAAPVLVMDSVVTVDAPIADWAALDFIDEIQDDAEVTVTFTDAASMTAAGTYQVTRLYFAVDACGQSSNAGQLLMASNDLPSGCTYAEASNYDPAAVNNNGTCLFATDCPDLNNDNVVGTSDLLILLSSFNLLCD